MSFRISNDVSRRESPPRDEGRKRKQSSDVKAARSQGRKFALLGDMSRESKISASLLLKPAQAPIRVFKEIFRKDRSLKYRGFVNARDEPDGEGKWFKDGAVTYSGRWENGKREGRGVSFEGGAPKYTGFWEEGLQSGYGTLMTPFHTIALKGGWDEGLPRGRCNQYDESGRVEFIGGLENGLRHGDGVSYYKHGKPKCKGTWVNGRLEGRATEYREDGGLLYQGFFQGGERHGQGVYFDHDLSKFEGEWERGALIRGRHTLTQEWLTLVYEGEFKNFKYHGQGVQFFYDSVYSIGFKYQQGRWEEGFLIHGEKYNTSDGSLLYFGEFRNGAYHGHGKQFISSEGLVEGVWEKGLLISGKELHKGSTIYQGSYQSRKWVGDGDFYLKDAGWIPETAIHVAQINLIKRNDSHMAEVKEQQIPRRAERSIDFKTLFEVFNAIPFTDEIKVPGQISPSSLKDEGRLYTSGHLFKNLELLKKRVEGRLAFTGTPKAADQAALMEFYDVYENLLKHLILKVKELTEAAGKAHPKEVGHLLQQRNRLIVELALSVNRCGTMQRIVAHQLYGIYCAQKVEILSLKEQIDRLLQQIRINLVDQIIYRIGASAHAYNAFYWEYAKELGLPQIGFPDPLAPKRVVKDMHILFDLMYDVSKILKPLTDEINDKANYELKELIIDWLKEHVPPPFEQLKVAEYRKKVGRMRKAKKTESEMLKEFKGEEFSQQKGIETVILAAKRSLYAQFIPEKWNGAIAPKSSKSFKALRDDLAALHQKITDQEELQERSSSLLRRHRIPIEDAKSVTAALEDARKSAFAKQTMPVTWDTPQKAFAQIEKEVMGLTRTSEIARLFQKQGISKDVAERALKGYQTIEELIESARASRYLESVIHDSGRIAQDGVAHLLVEHGIFYYEGTYL